jgi:hypothetical protein
MLPDVDIGRDANAHYCDRAQQHQDKKPFHGTQDNRAGRELTVTKWPMQQWSKSFTELP